LTVIMQSPGARSARRVLRSLAMDIGSGGTRGEGVRMDAVADGPDEAVRLTAWVRGQVQGVGFRWWVRARALELGLVGSAANLRDRRVEVVAEGSRMACERLLELLRSPGTPGQVSGVVEQWGRPRGDLVDFLER
jgi:acylphosphatase